MDASQQILGVIPARFGSTRFPCKPLTLIAGRSLVARVYERARQASELSRVLVATDDKRIAEHCEELGIEAVMTAQTHRSGTDRVAEVAERFPAFGYVNIQGDEPMIPPAAIDSLVQTARAASAGIATLVCPIAPQENALLEDPNVVKVVQALDGHALYFSRLPVPFPRHPESARYYQHIGIYYFTREALQDFAALTATPLELTESLEQLRALEHGRRILTVEFPYRPLSVDTPDDVALVEARLAEEDRKDHQPQ